MQAAPQLKKLKSAQIGSPGTGPSRYPPGGIYDAAGFYVYPDGSFVDPDGYFFDTFGLDEVGGYYDGSNRYQKPAP